MRDPSSYIIWETSNPLHSHGLHNTLHSICGSSEKLYTSKLPNHKSIQPKTQRPRSRGLVPYVITGATKLIRRGPFPAFTECTILRRPSTLHKSVQDLSKVRLYINYSQVSLRTVFFERSKLKLTIKEDIRSR